MVIETLRFLSRGIHSSRPRLSNFSIFPAKHFVGRVSAKILAYVRLHDDDDDDAASFFSSPFRLLYASQSKC